jgi:large subunit ribosomal protein L37Ae
MAKKQGRLKGLGARYGIKIRKQYSQVHHLMKSQRKCPECGGPVIREVVGIWFCKKCTFKIAGTAYDVKF